MHRSTTAQHRMLVPHTPIADALHNAPEVIVRGEGIRVWNEHGREFVEGVAGLWCANLGFSATVLADAAAAQFATLPFYGSFNNRTHRGALDLADQLVDMFPLPMARVFFANSGSEANDTALKLVWYYNNAVDRPRKKKVVSFRHGYHGVTVGAGSLTGLEHIHEGFDLPLAPVAYAPTPDYRAALPGETEDEFAQRMVHEVEQVVLREHPDTVAAMIVEPVMGAGGLVIPPAGYYPRLQEVLQRYDMLLVVDEVITGFGRTGRMFGCETFGLRPDIVTFAKGLSAAYAPISAVLVGHEVMEAVTELSTANGSFGHGFTYSGHPVGTAVALAALGEYRKPGFLEGIRARALELDAGLAALSGHEAVSGVRSLGMLGGVDLVPSAVAGEAGKALVRSASDAGLVLRAMGDTVVLAPPLVASPDDLDELFARLGRALDGLGRRPEPAVGSLAPAGAQLA